MSFTLRAGRPGDIDAILTLDQEYSPVFAQAESYERLLGKGGLMIVAEEAQALIAFAACSRVLDEATLLNIAVLPRVRGRGVAKLLLEEVMQRLAQTGTGQLFLEVRESNHRARSLYAAAGFRCDGERAGYYAANRRGADSGNRRGAAETAILMSRQLGDVNAGT
ncbi:GNAT family N-acetyltransferase [Congregibacter litoralis]|uniref:[SSU ribosomal protein S18P]-alanine acetyltransferase n=1 Tax=Congregibacter litoralis KT71 TaxID=314285 RepID=A4ACM9_9GAMM|nr:GNAT family N-acetyltransferase [Congregibacter litoralis]EAQ96243.1 [SSU ribosomal protein S18P]-alanine acetyltransferase [Congregibacter litoralis KT71]